METRILEDKVCIVTGAASGIGKGISELFAREGAKIIAVDLNEKQGEKLVEGIREDGEEAIFLKTDVSNSTDVRDMIRESTRKSGKIDVLCNNAGIFETSPVTEMSENTWDRVIDVNLKGVFLCSKYAIPELKKNRGGAIVNISSAGALFPGPNESAYGASKAGVIALTKTLAQELASSKVRANCICPGPASTEMFLKLGDKVVENVKEKTPLKSLAPPEEVAKAALYLASDLSTHITGEYLTVDGGLTLSP